MALALVMWAALTGAASSATSPQADAVRWLSLDDAEGSSPNSIRRVYFDGAGKVLMASDGLRVWRWRLPSLETLDAAKPLRGLWTVSSSGAWLSMGTDVVYDPKLKDVGPEFVSVASGKAEFRPLLPISQGRPRGAPMGLRIERLYFPECFDITTDGALAACAWDDIVYHTPPVPDERSLKAILARDEVPLALQDILVFDPGTGEVKARCEAPTRPREETALYLGLGHKPLMVQFVAFSPRATRVAAYMGSGDILVWSTKGGNLLAVLRGKPSRPMPLSVRPVPFQFVAEDRLVTSVDPDIYDEDPVVRLVEWDVTSAKSRVLEWDVGASAAVTEGADSGAQQAPPWVPYGLALLPDERAACLVSSTGGKGDPPAHRVELFELEGSSLVGSLSFPRRSAPRGLVVSPCRTWVAIHPGRGGIWLMTVEEFVALAKAGVTLEVPD